jgi:hypothetical protein
MVFINLILVGRLIEYEWKGGGRKEVSKRMVH